MNGTYLIPANSKKSMLLFGLFTKLDLVLFTVGVSASLLALLIFPIDELTYAIIALAPGLIAGFLVIPIPNYHNMRVVIKSLIEFYTTRQKYVWKGWCLQDGSKFEKPVHK